MGRAQSNSVSVPFRKILAQILAQTRQTSLGFALGFLPAISSVRICPKTFLSLARVRVDYLSVNNVRLQGRPAAPPWPVIVRK